jgi:hypothetical protein
MGIADALSLMHTYVLISLPSWGVLTSVYEHLLFALQCLQSLRSSCSVFCSVDYPKATIAHKSDKVAAFAFCGAAAYVNFQWMMSLLLTLNRYYALCKPTQVKQVGIGEKSLCIQRPLQAFINKRTRFCTGICLTIALGIALLQLTAQPHYRRIEIESNITVYRYSVRNANGWVSIPFKPVLLYAILL